MAEETEWIEVRCPLCNRWVGAVTPNWNVKSKMKVKCKQCRVYVIFPAGKADSPKRTIIQETED